MTVTATSFRLQFPAFESATAYPDPMIAIWLAVAVQQVNEARWSTLTDFGVSLYTAHNLVLESVASTQGAQGVAPAGRLGIQTSKSADGVSVSYDTSSTAEKDAGHWNATSYGARFYRLMKQTGAGPLQVGADDSTTASISAAAWAGPPYLP